MKNDVFLIDYNIIRVKSMSKVIIDDNVSADLTEKLGHGQFGGGSDGNFTGAMGIPTLDG
ncbi:MAG: hypothetical protein CFH16_00229, partial [Alphaproteobacteria bacterium MarineAlpha5_Bin6]